MTTTYTPPQPHAAATPTVPGAAMPRPEQEPLGMVRLSRTEAAVVQAVRRIQRQGQPCILVVAVDACGVSIRVCGPPERVRESDN